MTIEFLHTTGREAGGACARSTSPWSREPALRGIDIRLPAVSKWACSAYRRPRLPRTEASAAQKAVHQVRRSLESSQTEDETPLPTRYGLRNGVEREIGKVDIDVLDAVNAYVFNTCGFDHLGQRTPNEGSRTSNVNKTIETRGEAEEPRRVTHLRSD